MAPPAAGTRRPPHGDGGSLLPPAAGRTQRKQKCVPVIKIVQVDAPKHVSIDAAHFRALVQEMTGNVVVSKSSLSFLKSESSLANFEAPSPSLLNIKPEAASRHDARAARLSYAQIRVSEGTTEAKGDDGAPADDLQDECESPQTSTCEEANERPRRKAGRDEAPQADGYSVDSYLAYMGDGDDDGSWPLYEPQGIACRLYKSDSGSDNSGSVCGAACNNYCSRATCEMPGGFDDFSLCWHPFL